MFTKVFWRDTFERMCSTAAQAALLVLGADAIDALRADWETVGGFALGGAVLALLKALGAKQIGDRQSASLDPEIAPKILGKA